jgi:hypothetical protein
MDGAGAVVGTEEFRAARAPAGWRYVSEIRTSDPEPHRETVDLVVDDAWRPRRLRIDTGTHELLVSAADGTLAGTRDGAPVEIPWDGEDVDYLSPCFNGVTAERLASTAEIEVLYLEPFTLETRVERQRYELLGDEQVTTPVGRFTARAWRYTALPSGWSRLLWVADGIVVAYEDLFELVAYEPGASGPFPR